MLRDDHAFTLRSGGSWGKGCSEVDIEMVRGKESKSVEYAIEDSENEDCSATMFVLRDIEHDLRLGDGNLKAYSNDDLALVGRWQ